MVESRINPTVLKMKQELQIGQSLTTEQVRDLPDGARVRVENSDGKLWTELDAVNQVSRDNIAYGLDNGGWSRAYLVSLPSQDAPASPGDGYRWVEKGERIVDSDTYLASYGEWIPTGGLETTCLYSNKYRRRIEPDPAPVAEIEKEAALALLAGKLQELQALGVRDYVCRVVDNYRAAVAYAKSKGAL